MWTRFSNEFPEQSLSINMLRIHDPFCPVFQLVSDVCLVTLVPLILIIPYTRHQESSSPVSSLCPAIKSLWAYTYWVRGIHLQFIQSQSLVGSIALCLYDYGRMVVVETFCLCPACSQRWWQIMFNPRVTPAICTHSSPHSLNSARRSRIIGL